ncbi:MAG: hypothetical protein DMG67_05415 [Acidobacteria bacterium]|nr:MAG: hypothetical protein DMG67_05415 [Acidobacteriota bacterium]
MIVRDVELLRKFAENNHLSVHVTVTTMDIELARILEPRAPRPDLRMQTVRELANAGLSVGVNCAPVLPEITDSVANLESVVAAALEAGAHRIHANPLYLKPCSEKVFMPFLAEQFPHLVEGYKQRYAKGAFLSKSYHERISKLMDRLLQKHNFRPRRRERRFIQTPEWQEEQMKLF